MSLKSRIAALFFMSSAVIHLGCESSSSGSLPIELVSPGGTNPVRTVASGEIQLWVRQGTSAERELMATAPIVNGDFRIDLPIFSYVALTEVTVEVFSNGTPFAFGRTPQFLPIGYGAVNVLTAPRQTCSLVSQTTLGVPRHHAALVRVDTNLIAVGGIDGENRGTPSFEFVNSLQLTDTTATEFAQVEQTPDETQALRLAGTTELLVLGQSAQLLFDVSGESRSDRVLPLLLHPGAGDGTLVGLGPYGAAVVGGDLGDASSGQISFVDLTGTVTSFTMATPRTHPAAIRWSETQVLVAGGQSEGEPLFELITMWPPDARTTVPFGPTGTRNRPSLVASPAGDSALLIGGEDASGALVPSTWVVQGCTDTSCSIAAGPTWGAPRRGFAIVRELLIGGSNEQGIQSEIDQVVFDSNVTILPWGNLAIARTDLFAAEYAAGMLVVGAGRGRERVLSDLELCVLGQ